MTAVMDEPALFDPEPAARGNVPLDGTGGRENVPPAEFYTAKGQCPHCNHLKSKHRVRVGCEQGWRYDDDGTPVQTGCICASLFPPPLRVVDGRLV